MTMDRLWWLVLVLGVLSMVSLSLGWIPPLLEEDDSFESVHEYRRRLKIAYNYTPELVHPELCRYRSESSCEMLDNGMKLNRQRQEKRQRQLAVPTTSRSPVKVLLLFLQFSDHGDRNLPDVDYFQQLWSGDIKKWYLLNSHGNFIMEPVVTPWVVLGQSEAYWGAGQSGYTDNIHKMVNPALEKLDAQSDWDWSDFDIDSDGYLDAVVAYNSGHGAEQNCPNEKNDRNNRVWPHQTYFQTDGWRSTRTNLQLDNLVVMSVYGQKCTEDSLGAMSLPTHEFMHILGAPDLYDLGTDASGVGVGAFDLMGYAWGPKGNPNHPGHLSTWVKSQSYLNWLEPNRIRQDCIYTLRPAETTTDAIEIRLGNLPPELFEYFLFENRQQVEYDVDLWSNGLVIYHVDDMNDQINPGFPGQPGWPQNNKHYQVAVVQADGKYDLEHGVNRGDENDFYNVPGTVWGPGKGNTIFPNTDARQGGTIRQTGITVTLLEPEESGVVRFEIKGLGPACEETEKPTSAPTRVPEEEEEEEEEESTLPQIEQEEEEEEEEVILDWVIIDAPTGVLRPTRRPVPEVIWDAPARPTSRPVPGFDWVVISAPTGVVRPSLTAPTVAPRLSAGYALPHDDDDDDDEEEQRPTRQPLASAFSFGGSGIVADDSLYSTSTTTSTTSTTTTATTASPTANIGGSTTPAQSTSSSFYSSFSSFGILILLLVLTIMLGK